MKIALKSLLLATALFAFTGCGGGGGGGDSLSTPETPATPATPTTPETPASSSIPNPIKGIDGTAATGSISSSGGTYTYTYNGTQVNVSPTGLSAGNLLSMTTNGVKYATGGTRYSYSRFGGVSNPSDLTKSELYAVGTKTESMPTTGTATYSGLVVNNNLEGSAATFNVNYGAKTITGSTSTLSFTDGTISGSDFSGTVSGNGKFNGSFFGPNAEELGGTGTTNGTGFSFGAKK